MMPYNDDIYMGVEEVAETLSLSEVEVIRLVRGGQLRNRGTHNMIRVSRIDAEAYSEEHSNGHMELDNGDTDEQIDSEGDYDDENEATSEPDTEEPEDTSRAMEAGPDAGIDRVSGGTGAFARYAVVAAGPSPDRGGYAAGDSGVKGIHSDPGEPASIETLSESVRQLTALVSGMQGDITKLKPEEYAPDDADLREDAAAVSKALMDPESGSNILPLGGRDREKSKASERLVDAMFNTPDSKIDEMTDVANNLAAAAAAGVRTLNDYVRKAFDRKPNDPPLFMSDMYLNNVFRLNRSIGGKHMMRALAMTQIERESEEAQEKNIVFGSGSGDY